MNHLGLREGMALTVLAFGLAACGDSGSTDMDAKARPAERGHSKYQAKVRRTDFGIPHIEARDYGSLGYGLGYVQAEDNLCVLLDDFITDRGERARWFGRNGSYTIVPNGVTANNVASDFFWRFLITDEAIAKLRAASLPEASAASTGFKDGFNRYLREIKAGRHAGRHAACRSAPWLQELEDDDMYRRYIRLAVIASSSVFINDIVAAQPPAGLPAGAPVPGSSEMVQALRADPGALGFFLDERSFGSNMYALGSEATASGMPIVFGNPHFPWSGTERLYIFHARMPGTLDIMGSALYGVPAVLIGFNNHFAWSHTVSTAFRFTFYELTLAPGDPTAYLYEGQVRRMQAVPVTIQVRNDDGSLSEETRTLYRSHYGPMMTLTASGVNIFPWSSAKAYTLRDANFENDRLINQFFLWNRAQSLDEFIGLHKSVLGIPWVNTVASGPGGKAYYGDVSVVPNVPNSKVRVCSTSVQAQALAQLVPGLPLLDGSRASCEWDTDADAPVPGIFGPKNLPTLMRDDWVHNCNDSYWLTNPAQPIEGYNRIIGNERAERSLRTRLCILQVQQRLAGSDGYPGNKFDLPTLQDIVLSSRIHTGELARDDVIDAYCRAGTVMTQGGPVNVADACAVLRGWDLKDNVESVGGHIWREFFRGVGGISGRWLTPFSVSDPVNTPRDLNTAHPQVQDAFGRGVSRVRSAGIAMDAPMGGLQRSGVIGDTVIPIFGGEGFEGAFTIANSGPIGRSGYPVRYGNSYIQTVTWEKDRKGYTPIADGFVTYSQSTDPASPHFFDFTEAYSAKRWHRFPFRERDIAAQSVQTLQLKE